MRKVICTSSENICTRLSWRFQCLGKSRKLPCFAVLYSWGGVHYNLIVLCNVFTVQGGSFLHDHSVLKELLEPDCIRLHCLEILVEGTSSAWSSLETSLWSAVFALWWTMFLLISFTFCQIFILYGSVIVHNCLHSRYFTHSLLTDFLIQTSEL